MIPITRGVKKMDGTTVQYCSTPLFCMNSGFEHRQSSELPISNSTLRCFIGCKLYLPASMAIFTFAIGKRQFLSQQLMCSCGVRPYPGSRRPPGKAWSSVSGGSTVGRDECVSYHSPWEDHGPVSCCSKICQDAFPGKAAWLSAVHHCHCGDP